MAGKVMIDCAKISGIMPTGLTRSGMCVLAPPYCLRPRTRLPYCTGTRRIPSWMNTMTTMVTSTIATKSTAL